MRTLLSVSTATLTPSQDTTIYSVAAGDLSNGAGQSIVVGGAGGVAEARRGLVAFDLSDAQIPVGATILDAVLTMNIAQVFGGTTSISLHPVTTVWNESASDADGDEFNGTQALTRDATWAFGLYGSLHWNNAGGDFSAPSATASPAGNGVIEWIGGALVDDVQNWLDDPQLNNGWMLIGEEQIASAQSFHSRDSLNPALQPHLEITWEDPWTPSVVEGRKWHDINADGIHQQQQASNLQLTFAGGRDYYNSFGGGEYWYWSQSSSAWFFLTPDGNLSQWDRSPRTLSGPVIAQPGPRAWNNPTALIASSESVQAEPWLNGFTFQLIDGSGQIVAETQSRDIDLNGDGQIQPDTERGWYRFENVAPGEYRVREQLTNGWTQSAGRMSPLAENAWLISQSLELEFTGNLHQNFGGLGEKWLWGSAGWHFVTPDGTVSRWDGQTVTSQRGLQGTVVAGLTNEYFRDPSLLYAARQPRFLVTSGSVTSGLNFGNYREIEVAGRIWNERDPNGIRNNEAMPEAQLVAVPTGVPDQLQTATWYGIPADNTQQLYCITALGEVFFWSQATGAVLHTRISEAAMGDPQVIRNFAFAEEQWLNEIPLELLDSDGHVVARTVSQNRDINGDGNIDPSTESGWYAFAGLLPGNYSLRQVTSNGVIEVSQTTPAESRQLMEFSQQYGFRLTNRDHFNFGGLNERWLRDRFNQWYFITPDGRIRLWDRVSGGTLGDVTGTEIGQVSSAVFVNLNLLVAPQNPLYQLAESDSLNLNLGQSRILDTVFAELASDLT